MMDELSMWCVNDTPAGLSRSQAKIDVIEDDGQVQLVESANFVKYFAPHRQTSGRHSAKILREMLTGEVARINAPDSIDMTCNAHSEDNASVLELTVGIP